MGSVNIKPRQTVAFLVMAFSWIDSSELEILTSVFDGPQLMQEMKRALCWMKSGKQTIPETRWPVPHSMEKDKLADSLNRKIMAEAFRFNRLSDLQKYLPDPVCEVRPSSIHGLGVFATRNVEAFRYLTVYPCDGASWHPVIGRFKMGDNGMCFGWPQNVSFLERHSYQQEIVPPAGARAMAIYGDPLLHDNPHFVGHMINDGATCKSPERVEIYDTISNAKANCMFISSFGVIISLKPIKAGEELLTSYGSTYWLTRYEEIERIAGFTVAAFPPDVDAQLEQPEQPEQVACQSDGVAYLDQLD